MLVLLTQHVFVYRIMFVKEVIDSSDKMFDKFYRVQTPSFVEMRSSLFTIDSIKQLRKA